MLSAVEALAGRILGQENKPPKPVKFHMTPFEPVPVADMEGVEIRYLIIYPYGPVEMLPVGIYVETDIPPAQFEASPDSIIRAIEDHINAGVEQKETGPDRNNRLRLANRCLSPLGYLMFKVATGKIT